ncbi:MAG: flagellar basal body-associated FliL family protein [Cellulomonas sp.]|nr:flagellar basal body-associated FliL family protein [Cellulomonas sp.]
MPIEQRVIAQPKIGGGKIGGGSSTPPAEEPAAGKKKGGKGGSKKKLLLIVGPILVIAIAAAVYFLVLAPKSGAGTPAATPAPSPGVVLTIDPISVNLAEGHYLRIGLALQLTDKVGEKEKPTPAKALDAAITLFSGHTVAEVSDPATRESFRAELEKSLEEIYEGEVMGVYFTNFVTQ